MATTTYLTNPTVTVTPGGGGPVDLTDQCTSASVTHLFEALEVTAFGDSGRKYAAGLQNNEITLTMFLSYGSGEVEETLHGCLVNPCTVVVTKGTGNPSASNPRYTLTGAYLESFTPINGSVGEMSTVEATFTGGTMARAIS